MILASIERLRGLDVPVQEWRDKIAIVWMLKDGSSVMPQIPDVQNFAAGREFEV